MKEPELPRGLESAREKERMLSKKNHLVRRKKQHEFDHRREELERKKRENKLQAKKSKTKIDGSDMKRKKKNSGIFQVGKKKVKTKLSALAKTKAARAKEIDKQT